MNPAAKPLLVAALLSGCSPTSAAPLVVPSTTLYAAIPGGSRAQISLLDPSAQVTVLEFFSAHCPCQTAHDARLRDLYARYHPRGVGFRAISSEESIDPSTEAQELSRRRYPYPVLHDEAGSLARALGADYATYTVVVDPRGRILFRGGIDSDKRTLHEDATPYLAEALDDILQAHPVRRPNAKTLGCALQIH